MIRKLYGRRGGIAFLTQLEPSNGWQDGDFKGDIRATWGHVMAPGSIHPESREPYTVLWDLPLAPVPDWVRSLKQQKRERVVTGDEPITEWRNDAMIRLLGKMREAGFSDDMLRTYALQANAERFVPWKEAIGCGTDASGEVVLSNPSRFKRDKDGKEATALALIAATRQSTPGVSYVELSRMLLEHGIERSLEWIRKRDKRSGADHRSD